MPARDSPTSAPRRAVSVASVSADGRARSSSEYCSTRPGAGSISIVTTSIAAAGGCDSRSSSSSVRRTFASRIAAGSCRQRACSLRSTSRSVRWMAAAPRSARSSAADERIEQPRQDERQRLEPVDRPLELDPLEKPRHFRVRDAAAADRRHTPAAAAPCRARPAATRDRRPAAPPAPPAVVNPQRRSAANAFSYPSQIVCTRAGAAASGRMPCRSATSRRKASSGTCESAGAGGPVRTVSDGCVSDNNIAAVCVGATATAIGDEACAAHVRCSSAPIACASPSRRPRPETSKTAQPRPNCWTRGENARATADGRSGNCSDRTQAKSGVRPAPANTSRPAVMTGARGATRR